MMKTTEQARKEMLLMHTRLSEYLQENSIDCVILGYESGQLKVLLLKWKFEELWSLPGGHVQQSEGFDQAAHRILRERTGLISIFLKQFYTFSSPNRKHNAGSKEANLMKKIFAYLSDDGQQWNVEWFAKRFVTTGYFALVNIAKTNPTPDFLSDRCEWMLLDEVPKLLLDHNEILDKALEALRIQLNYLPIGLSLLPEKFTMKDLQQLYEAILKKPLERSNFQRRMLKSGILIRHEKQMTGAANKAPYLYSFDKKKYETLIEQKGDF